jgi:hypothetical protein
VCREDDFLGEMGCVETGLWNPELCDQTLDDVLLQTLFVLEQTDDLV